MFSTSCSILIKSMTQPTRNFSSAYEPSSFKRFKIFLALQTDADLFFVFLILFLLRLLSWLVARLRTLRFLPLRVYILVKLSARSHLSSSFYLVYLLVYWPGFSFPNFSDTSRQSLRYRAAIDFLDFFSFFFSSVLFPSIFGSDIDLTLLVLRDF